MIAVTRMQAQEIQDVWPQIEALFLRLNRKHLRAPALDEVKARLMIGDWQLWVAHDHDELRAALATGVILEKDGSKTLSFEQIAGDRLNWPELMAAILAWGRSQLCVRWMIRHARKGWPRRLKLGRVTAVTLEGPL